MKKVYSKPEIMFESFTMSKNIAAGCEKTFSGHGRGSCPVAGSADGFTLFNDALNGGPCDIQGGEDVIHDGFCYHNPNPEMNWFNS